MTQQHINKKLLPELILKSYFFIFSSVKQDGRFSQDHYCFSHLKKVSVGVILASRTKGGSSTTSLLWIPLLFLTWPTLPDWLTLTFLPKEGNQLDLEGSCQGTSVGSIVMWGARHPLLAENKYYNNKVFCFFSPARFFFHKWKKKTNMKNDAEIHDQRLRNLKMLLCLFLFFS